MGISRIELPRERVTKCRASRAVRAFLDDADQQVDRNGNPDLGLDCILPGSEEGLDPQMLLDLFEQQIYILPINTVLLKSRSTTASIRCARTACQ